MYSGSNERNEQDVRGTSNTPGSGSKSNSISTVSMNQNQSQSQNQSQNAALAASYANKTSTAFKASGALARLSKAIYSGGSALTGGGSSRGEVEFYINPVEKETLGSRHARSLSYTAKSAILAMAQNSDYSSVAIAGHDFFHVLRIGDDVSIRADLRGQKKTRQFDKLYTVTNVKWANGPYASNIALATSGGDIFIYDVERGSQPQQQMRELNRAVHTLGFSAKAPSQLLSGSNDGVVRLWDIRQGDKPVMTFLKTGDAAKELQFRPWDSSKFAAIYNSGIVQRWDLRNPNGPDRKLNAHTGSGACLDWHPELDYIVTGGRDQQIQIWNMSSEGRTPDYIIQAPNSVSKVRWQHGDGFARHILNSSIASCGGRQDYKVHVWNMRRPHIPTYVLESHTEVVSEIGYVAHKVLRTASKDSLFIQHDLEHEPLVIDNMSSQALDWLSTNDVSFASQIKQRKFRSIQKSRTTSMVPTEDVSVSSLPEEHLAGIRRSRTTTPTHSVQSELNLAAKMGSINVRRSNGALQWLEVEYNQFVCDAVLPRDDPQAFAFLANNYKSRIYEGQDISDVCLENSAIAAEALKLRTARTWEVIGKAVLREEIQFASSMATAGIGLTGAHHRKGAAPESAGVNATSIISEDLKSQLAEETRRHSRSRSRSMLSRPLPDKSMSPVSKARVQQPEEAVADDDRNSLTSDPAALVSNSATQTGYISSAGPVPIPQSSSTHTGTAPFSITHSMRQGMRFLSGMDSVSFANTQLTSSSPDDSYGGLRDRGEGEGQNFTQLAMPDSSLSSTSHVLARNYSFSTNSTEASEERPRLTLPETLHEMSDLENDDNKSTLKRRGRLAVILSGSEVDEVESTDLASKSSLEPSDTAAITTGTSRLGQALSRTAPMNSIKPAPDGGRAITEIKLEENVPDGAVTLLDMYHRYQEELAHPWRAEQLIRKSVEFAENQGDALFLVVISTLLKDMYPKAFPGPEVVEEWNVMYIDLLRRERQFVAASEIVKETSIWSIHETGLTGTQFDPLCHLCKTPLSENGKSEFLTDESKIGYWYCASCKQMLSGCILCNAPIKGLSIAFFSCGHKGHISCLKSWVETDQMRECPSGCGEVIGA